jgi:hypothetical protein
MAISMIEAKISNANVQVQIVIQVERKNVMILPIQNITLAYIAVKMSSIFAPSCLSVILYVLIGFDMGALAIGTCRSTGGAASLNESVCASEKHDYTTNPNCSCPQMPSTTRGKLKCSLRYDPGPGLTPITLYGCQ